MIFALRTEPLKGFSRHVRFASGFREKYGAFINGVEFFEEQASYFDVHSPATCEKLCSVLAGNEKTISKAVDVAQQAFESGVWSKSDVRHRAKVLNNVAEELRKEIPRLIELEVWQTGRAKREMTAQLGRLPEWFEYFAALIRTQEGTCPPFLGKYVNYVQHVPLGVCGLLTPWNHPMLIAIKKIAPALAAGNSIVLKPSELAPVSVLELGAICTRAGVPVGVLNIVPGLGSVTGKALCSHPHVKKVDLTGGTSTGRLVGSAAGANLASVVSELGGKAPMIMFSDCDVEQAVNGAAFASFVASGQTCIMGARLVVHESIMDKLVGALVAKANKIRLGDPFHADTQMGPVISANSLERITEMVNTAVTEGAEVLAGGFAPTLPAPFGKGHYYAPTILRVNSDMKIWKEEVFGPVLVVQSFKDEDEAIALANDSPYGLAAAVWTKDVMRAHRVAEELNVGIVWINDHHRNDPSSPWGGMKDSGIGRENGIIALQEYSQSRSVVVRTDPTPFDWFVDVDADKVRYS